MQNQSTMVRYEALPGGGGTPGGHHHESRGCTLRCTPLLAASLAALALLAMAVTQHAGGLQLADMRALLGRRMPQRSPTVVRQRAFCTPRVAK
jgi:hypothetical protein